MRKLVFLLFLVPSISFGQTIYSIHFHNSYEVSDSTLTVSFNLTGENTFETWAGNTILIETRIKSEEANERLLKYLKEKGRYEIVFEKNTTAINIASKNQDKRGIITKSGELEERIYHNILIPETFVKTGDNNYRKNTIE